MDASGGTLAKHEAKSMADLSVEGFERTASGPVKEYLDVKAKAASGDKDAIVELAIRDTRSGGIADAETLDKRLAGTELNAEQKALVAGFKADFKLAPVLKKLRPMFRTDRETAGKLLGDELQKMLKAGEMPTKKYANLYGFAFNHCLNNGDVETAAKAYERLHSFLKDEPRAANFLTQAKARLEEAKKASKEEAEEVEEPEAGEETTEEVEIEKPKKGDG